MANDVYTANADGGCYIGMFSAPAWRIGQAESTFKNISLNTLASQKPPLWASIGNSNGPFSNWSGGVLADDYGKYGAYAVIGSGHLSQGANIVAGAWVFDLDTQFWSMKSGPEYPILENVTNLNTYGESIDAENLGHPTVPHTYNGLVYQPEALGGATGGSIIRNFHAGSSYGNIKCAHKYDLINTYDVPQRVIDSIPTQTSYPASALDEGRGGYWIVSQNLAGSIFFVNYSDFSQTQFSGVDVPAYGGNCITYIPAPYDCLVAVGSIGTMSNLDLAIHISRIVNGIPQKWQRVNYSGRVETGGANGHGAVWSEMLGCLVRYEGGGSNQVIRINPPEPENILTQDWVFEYEAFTGVDSAVPSYAHINNGTWNRFVESKQLRTFLWCGGVGEPVQSWRLRGM